MAILRTPESCFANLVGYPFAPHYVDDLPGYESTRDPVLGPPVMTALRKVIRNCPSPYEHPEAGHFTQEWGEDIARRALVAFSLG